MHKTIVCTIRDRSPHTKKDVEVFSGLIEKGYVVMDQFSYKNESYYIMMLHEHGEFEGEKQSN